jgi:hypothetical protein
MREKVVLVETDPLGGLIYSVVGYVISLIRLVVLVAL